LQTLHLPSWKRRVDELLRSGGDERSPYNGLIQPKREKLVVMSLEEAVAIFSKWKDDSAQILAPEGSVLVLLSEGLIVVLIAIIYRRRRFPLITDPAVGYDGPPTLRLNNETVAERAIHNAQDSNHSVRKTQSSGCCQPALCQAVLSAIALIA